MGIACKLCIMDRGLRPTDITGAFKTEEELWEHMEYYHHCVVKREGESQEEAIARFIKNHPQALNCPECIARGAPWTRKEVKT